MWLSPRLPQHETQRASQPSPPAQQRHESMVQAAHQHFCDSDSSSASRPSSARTPRSQSTVAADTDALVSLHDHMDSFPLVPLPVIPRLSLADLRTCQDGLLQLLQSLSGPNASDDDAQLAKYASRQLSLVQRHIEQARARERVMQLISGQVSVQATPLASALQQQPHASAKALPIFLTPSPPSSSESRDGSTSSTSSSVRTAASSLTAPTPELQSTRSTASLGSRSVSSAALSSASVTLKKTKKEAIEAAKALIQASLKRGGSASRGGASSTSFVIAAGDHSSSNSTKRRRHAAKAKKQTPAEQEQARALQVEKERERRRQEAYQRLLARQELQAAKKSKSKQETKKRHEAHVATVNDPGADTRVSDASTSSTQIPRTDTQAERATTDADASDESESDESDVSNCSDSDEANERAIMALEVTLPAPEDSTDNENADAPEQVSPQQDTANGAPSHGSNSDEDASASESASDDESEPSEGGTADVVEKAQDDDLLTRSRQREDASALRHRCTNESAQSLDRPEVEDDSEGRDVTESSRAPLTERASDDRLGAAQISLDLQTFMASRKAAMIEQLRQQKELRLASALAPGVSDAFERDSDGLERCDDSDRRAESSSDRSLQENQSTLKSTRDAKSLSDDVHCTLESPNSQRPSPRAAADQRRGASPPDKRPSSATAAFDDPLTKSASSQQQLQHSPQVRPSREPSVRVARPLTKLCNDYRAYFDNFHCILTSVFEQRHAFRSSNNTGSHTSLTTLPSHAPPVHDQSLRLQLKLYESWQSIMHDYATVFGSSIPTPRAMLPSSSGSSALSPFTAHYRINSTTRREVCDIVIAALEKLGDWDEHPSGLGLKTTWNLLWTWSKPRVERKTLLVWQKVNHFQHAKALTRKDCLKKNMGKYVAMGGKMKSAYDVVPLTFILPNEYIAFVQAFQDKGERLRRRCEERGEDASAAAGKNIWIMKPVALSRGRGISLVNALSDVVYGEQVVIQEYIANPLLLDGYKFDLRLYVLVTSFNPLEAFFYEDGFVRLCTRPYEDADLSNLFVHLTNSSIQKANQDAIETRCVQGGVGALAVAIRQDSTHSLTHLWPVLLVRTSDNPINAAAGEEAGGTKMTLAYLWKRLDAMGADVAKVKRDIDDVILKSLLCGEDHIPFQVNSFDLYGYDILLDDAFRPWLIEINSSPSMARENDLDYQVCV